MGVMTLIDGIYKFMKKRRIPSLYKKMESFYIRKAIRDSILKKEMESLIALPFRNFFTRKANSPFFPEQTDFGFLFFMKHQYTKEIW